ncbi:MAG TPA: response regulator [Trichocoleus sp.]
MGSTSYEPADIGPSTKILSARILIADDSRIVRLMLERALQNLVQETLIDQVSSGPEVFSYLKNNTPDIILLDILMPEINGYEVCRQIKEHPNWQHIPVIIVTAFSSKQTLAECLRAGAEDFIGKPVNELEIRARVHSMLRLKKQHDELMNTQHDLRAALEHLDTVLQMREDMSSMIVHDLRNPLSAAMLGCEVLTETELSTYQVKNVSRIEQELNYLNALIEDLLTISRIESGKLSLNLERVAVKDLLSEACSGLTSLKEGIKSVSLRACEAIPV